VAFPTTPLLDDFNRANANLTSPWGGYPLGTGATLMRVLANQLDGGNGNTFDGSYWSTTQFGPDTEVVVTIATDDAANNELIFLLARLTSPNTASYNGYGVNVNRSGGLVEFYKLTAGAQSLKTSVSTTFASGDKVGLEVVNSGADVIVRAYKFTGGSWSLLGSWTDVAPTSTFTGQGNIGFECRTGVTPKFDDWSGGTVIATSAGWVRPVRIPNPRVGPMALRHRTRSVVFPGPMTAAVTAVSTALAVVVEALQGVAAAGSGPVNAEQSVDTTAAPPIDATSGVASAAAAPVNASGGVAASAVNPLETAGAVSSTSSEPVESPSAVAPATSVVPVDASQGVAVPASVPLEALGAVVSALQEAVEAAGGIISAVVASIEAAGVPVTAVSATAVLPVDAVQAIVSALSEALDAAAQVAQVAGGPVDAAAQAKAAVVSPLETTAGVSASSTAPAEAVAAAVRAVVLPLESGAGFSVALVLPLDSELAVGAVIAGIVTVGARVYATVRVVSAAAEVKLTSVAAEVVLADDLA
jgi:hypothetical protein